MIYIHPSSNSKDASKKQLWKSQPPKHFSTNAIQCFCHTVVLKNYSPHPGYIFISLKHLRPFGRRFASLTPPPVCPRLAELRLLPAVSGRKTGRRDHEAKGGRQSHKKDKLKKRCRRARDKAYPRQTNRQHLAEDTNLGGPCEEEASSQLPPRLRVTAAAEAKLSERKSNARYSNSSLPHRGD